MRFVITIEVECDTTDDGYDGPRVLRTQEEVETVLRARYERASLGQWRDALVGLTVDRTDVLAS